MKTLDDEAIALFARKGLSDPRALRSRRNANAAKVRRVLQSLSDLSPRPLDELRILDLACGEGVYAIEAACQGATVVALDAREERMREGRACAQRNGVEVSFQQGDVRDVTLERYGAFDVVLFLGILYHLDTPDLFHILRNLHALTTGFLVVDTHIALSAPDRVEFAGVEYKGKRGREHPRGASAEDKRRALLQSYDNEGHFLFTRASLIELLVNTGFSSVYECHAPLEPSKPEGRVTFVARKGDPVRLATYPWINDRTEQQIAEDVRAPSRPSLKRRAQRTVNAVLERWGVELRRI